MKTKKKFDCVEMKHKAGERIYQDLKGKTVEEQVEYWRNIERKYEERDGRTTASSSIQDSDRP